MISIGLKKTLTKRHAAILAGLILLALILFVYWPVNHFDFVNYDDRGYTAKNPFMQGGFTTGNLKTIFSRDYLGNYHPLTLISHMLDWQLFGLQAGAHHWTNVILHMLNVLLLFLLFNKLTGALWRSAFIAGVFAIHPINVESVAWISERKNVLSTFFWILTLLIYLWYAKHPTWKKYLLLVTGFILGLLSKAMVVTLPFVLLLLDYWPLCRFKSDRPVENQIYPAKTKTLSNKILFLIGEKVPLFALSALFSAFAVLAHKNENALFSLQNISLTERLSNAVFSYVLYIKKFFWPFDLAIIYPYNHHIPSWQIVLSLIFLIAVTIYSCANFRKQPYLFTGWFWYLGTLVPVIGIVQVGDQAMADRYAYIPMIGLLMMLVWKYYDVMKDFLSNRILFLIGLAILSGFAFVAYRQVLYWQNTMTLFERALEVKENNAIAHSILAGEYLLRNMPEKALTHAHRALSLKPNDYDTLIRLAGAYNLMGDKERRIEILRRAVVLQPESARAYLALCRIGLNSGRVLDVIKECRKATELNSDIDHTSLHYEFGIALAAEGQYHEAAFQIEKYLCSHPQNDIAHYNLAMINLRQEKTDDAIKHFQKTLQLKPEFAHAHYQLAKILKNKGLSEEAKHHYQKAMRLNPRLENMQDKSFMKN